MSKILCFTVSYDRPYYIYNTINNILNQSFKDFTYSVKINIDNSKDENHYNKLLKDFTNDSRLKILYSNNESQQDNYLNAIKNGYDNQDILVKIDDDDIYHKNYLETGINLFNKSDADIISFNSYIHINNKKIYGNMASIGMWAGDKNQKINFGMPPTYFFNQKAYNLIKEITNEDIKNIHLFEDTAWRTSWRKNKLKSLIFDDEIFIYNIHGKNISSKFLYDNNQNEKIYLDNQYFSLYEFKHRDWISYLYLNKRNNRVYNINNDDHGSFKMLNNEKIEISWDDWGIEQYIKMQSKNYFERIG